MITVDANLTAEEATQLTLLYADYAMDRITSHRDGRHYAPQLAARLTMAQAQLKPAVELAKPEHDQIEGERA